MGSQQNPKGLETPFCLGQQIEKGVLRYDVKKLLYPGDLLHEAGHIALMTLEERKTIIGNVKEYRAPGQDDERGVMLRPYAALKHLHFHPKVVFHPEGY